MINLINALKQNSTHDDNFYKWLKSKYRFEGIWKHYSGPNLAGKLVWEDINHNIIPNAALTDMLSVYFASGTQSSNLYFVPSTGSPTFAAGDTPSSHAGWTENQDYDEATRQLYVGVVTGQNITNSASPAVINITTGSTFGGSALFNNNVKGGTTGIMSSGVVASEGNQVLGAGGSLSMVYSITATDGGA